MRWFTDLLSRARSARKAAKPDEGERGPDLSDTPLTRPSRPRAAYPGVTERLLSINYSEGRQGRSADVLVIHVTEGTLASARAWFNDPRSKVSSHYLVSRAGAAEQYVDEADTAWANGTVDRPTAAILLERPGVNPNLYTISIECEGSGTEELTDAQRATVARLVRQIANRNPRIKLDARHVIPHRSIRRSKSCPGKISVDKIIELVTMSPTPAPPPRVVWSDYFTDYLIVTRYTDDANWHFVRLKEVPLPPGTGVRASVRLSGMPLHRPL